jgi:hypothetical protein
MKLKTSTLKVVTTSEVSVTIMLILMLTDGGGLLWDPVHTEFHKY